MVLLFALLPLLFAPIIYNVVLRFKKGYDVLDGFTLSTVLGLVFFGVLPESATEVGPLVFLAALIGFLLPSLIENLNDKAEKWTHLVALFMVGIGLGLHSFLDGLGLSLEGATHQENFLGYLGWAIFLHQIPVGLGVWISADPQKHPWRGTLLLSFLVFGTLVGYYSSQMSVSVWHESLWMTLFQSLIAGSLVHILYHKQHQIHEQCSHSSGAPQWYQGLGALLGVALVFVMTTQFEHSHAHSHLESANQALYFSKNLLSFFMIVSPFLVLILAFKSLQNAIQEHRLHKNRHILKWFGIFFVHRLNDKMAPWIILMSLPLVYVLSLVHVNMVFYSQSFFVNVLGWPSSVILALLTFYSLLKRGPRRFIHEVIPCSSIHDHNHKHHHNH